MKKVFYPIVLTCIFSTVILSTEKTTRISISANPKFSVSNIQQSIIKKIQRWQSEYDGSEFSTPLRYYDDNIIWLGNITIGTPEQNFTVLFDTGAPILFVPDITCGNSSNETAPNPHTCSHKNRFNSSASSTYSEIECSNITSDDMGAIQNGTLGRDVVRIGDSLQMNRLTMPNTTFASMYQLDQRSIDVRKDGIFGLRYNYTINGENVAPISHAINQGQLAQPLFTIYLEYLRNNTGNGQITLGGFDTENCADIVGYVNLTSDYEYNFQLDYFQYGDGKLVWGINSMIRSDSGTYCLLAKPEVAQQIALAAGASEFRTDTALIGGYLIDCNATYDPLTFVINGHKYSLTSRTLNMDIGLENNLCLFGVVPADLGSWIDWIFGTPFLLEFCTVYDIGQHRLGFAPSKKSQLESDGNSAEKMTGGFSVKFLVIIWVLTWLWQ